MRNVSYKSISYNKSGANVKVQPGKTTNTYEITRNGKTLEMSFARRQKTQSEHYTRIMGGGASSAIRGDHIAIYDIGIKIDDQKQDFSASFVADHFDEWGNNSPSYDVTLEKGIPSTEHQALSKALAEQNDAVAQIFNDYIMDADALQKHNNLSSSIFNQKLNEFIVGK